MPQQIKEFIASDSDLAVDTIGIASDADIVTNDGGQKVYNSDKNLTYGYPSDYTEDQINFDQQTSIYGKDKSGFFGNVEMGWSIGERSSDIVSVTKNALKGAASYFTSLPSAGGGLIQEFGERMGEEPELGTKISDAYIGLLAPTVGQSLKEFRKVKQLASLTSIDESIASAGRRLSEANERFVTKLNIKPTEGKKYSLSVDGKEVPVKPSLTADKVAFDLGSGGASALASIGLAYATRNPSLVGSLFGLSQKGSKYQALRKKGKSSKQAGNISDVYGLIEGGIEALGLEVFMNMLRGSKTLSRIALRSTENGLQEIAQQGGEEIVDKLVGLEDRELTQIGLDSLYAGAIGFVVGLPASSIATITENRGALGKLRKLGLTDKEINNFYDTMQRVSKAEVTQTVSSALKEEADRIEASEVDPKTYQIAYEMNDAFDQIELLAEALGVKLDSMKWSNEEHLLDWNNPEDRLALDRAGVSKEMYDRAKEDGPGYAITARHSIISEGDRKGWSSITFFRGATAIDVYHEFAHAIEEQGGLKGFRGTKEEHAAYIEDKLNKGEGDELLEMDKGEFKLNIGQYFREKNGRQVIVDDLNEVIGEVHNSVRYVGQDSELVCGVGTELVSKDSAMLSQDQEINFNKPIESANAPENIINLRAKGKVIKDGEYAGKKELTRDADNLVKKMRDGEIKCVQDSKGDLYFIPTGVGAEDMKVYKYDKAIQVDNGKVKAFILDMPAIWTCKNCDSCAGTCYAISDQVRLQGVKLKRFANLYMFLNHRSKFMQMINEEISGNERNMVRLHTAGDIFSQKYLDFLAEIVAMNPDKRFYTYTKVTDLDTATIDKLSNWNLMSSLLPTGEKNFGPKEWVEQKSKELKIPICPATAHPDETYHCADDSYTGKGKKCSMCSRMKHMLFVEHGAPQRGIAKKIQQEIRDTNYYESIQYSIRETPTEGGKVDYLYRYHPKGDLDNVIRSGLTPYTQQSMNDRAWKSGDAIKWGWDKLGMSPDDVIENTTNDAGDAPRIFFTPEQWKVDKDRVQLRIKKSAIKHDLIKDKNLPPDVFIEGEDVGVPPEDIEIKVGKEWIPLNQYKSKLSPTEGGKVIYHGTPNMDLEFPTIFSKEGKNEAIFFTKDKSYAQNYASDKKTLADIGKDNKGGKIIEARLDPSAKILDASGTNENDNWHYPSDQEWEKIKEFAQNSNVNINPGYDLKPNEKLTWEAMLDEGASAGSGLGNPIVKIIKQLGYDGIDTTEVLGEKQVYMIWNKNVIKPSKLPPTEGGKVAPTGNMGGVSSVTIRNEGLSTDIIKPLHKNEIAIFRREIRGEGTGREAYSYLEYYRDVTPKQAAQILVDRTKNYDVFIDGKNINYRGDAFQRTREEIQNAFEDALSKLSPTEGQTAIRALPNQQFYADAVAFKKSQKTSVGSTIAGVSQGATELGDKALVPISTRMARIAEELRDALRKFEFAILDNTNKDYTTVKGALGKYSKLSEEDHVILDLALKNRDTVAVADVLSRNNMEAEFNIVNQVLEGIRKAAIASGMDVGLIADYFPRRIKNSRDFLDYLRGTQQWSAIEEAIRLQEDELGATMTDEERAEFINNMLRNKKSGIWLKLPANVKARLIDFVTPEMNKYYKDSGQALMDYIVSMNSAIEERKFFGTAEKDIDKGIGSYIRDLVDQGIITAGDEQEVREILKARFEQRGTHGVVSLYKNLAYIYTMGSPISAITQFGDLAFSLYKNGVIGTVGGLANTIANKNSLTKEDVGIENIGQEFTDQSKSGAAVSAVFKAVGLDMLDRLGKETIINAGMDRLSKLANSNDRSLAIELDRIFGAEAQQTLTDLKAKNPTTNVRYLLFSEVCNFQPVTLSEMPEYYLRGGNARIFYMLKTFTLKMLDVYHNEVGLQFKTDPTQAMKNLVRLSSYLILMGAGVDWLKDFILGRAKDISDYVVDNILKSVGMSKWTIYKARQEGWESAFFQMILPPATIFTDLYSDVIDVGIKQTKDLYEAKAWGRIPLIGKFYYWWFGGGRTSVEKKASQGSSW